LTKFEDTTGTRGATKVSTREVAIPKFVLSEQWREGAKAINEERSVDRDYRRKTVRVRGEIKNGTGDRRHEHPVHLDNFVITNDEGVFDDTPSRPSARHSAYRDMHFGRDCTNCHYIPITFFKVEPWSDRDIGTPRDANLTPIHGAPRMHLSRNVELVEISDERQIWKRLGHSPILRRAPPT
jgi:hypothetical protein